MLEVDPGVEGVVAGAGVDVDRSVAAVVVVGTVESAARVAAAVLGAHSLCTMAKFARAAAQVSLGVAPGEVGRGPSVGSTVTSLLFS